MSNRPATKARPRRGAARRGGSRARRRQQRNLFMGVSAAALGVLAVVFFVSRGHSGSTVRAGARSSSSAFQVGQPGPGRTAPAIRLPSTAGGTFDLASQNGKNVLLYFQEGVGCEPCWTQIRDVEKQMSDFRALGVDEFVSIAGNPLGDLRQKARDEQIVTPVLADPDLSLGRTYNANQYGMMGTSAYGHTFILVGPDGRIRWRADYGGSPHYTMYVKPTALLADLRAGLGTPAKA